MDKIKVNFQYLKYLHFNIFDAPKIFFADSLKPEVDVSIKVEGDKYGEKIYEVTLKITAKAHIKEENQYKLELHYAALCTVVDDYEEKELKTVLMVDVPSIIFPGARSIISNITRDANLASLLLSPINFLEIYQRNSQESDQD
jgi:preprotein translocase subunit SecB